MTNRIAIITPSVAPIGGAEQYVHSVMTELAHTEVEARCFSRISTESDLVRSIQLVPSLWTNDSDEGIAAVEAFNPSVIYFQCVIDPQAMFKLAQRYPSFLFTHSHFPIACPGDGKFLAGQRVPCTRRVAPFCMIAPWLQRCGSRNPWVHLPNYRLARQLTTALKPLRGFVVASEYMKRELTLNGFPEEKIHVIPIGIPTAGLEANADNSEGSPSPSPSRADRRIVFAGRMVAAKGPDILIQALREVSTPIQCDFYGEGPMLSTLKTMAATVPHHIQFHGQRPRQQVMQAMQASQAVVMPSVWPEPFGLSGVEALARGVPVIAFAVGGVPEWLDDSCGWLVSTPSPQALATAINSLVAQDSQSTEKGHAAVLRYRQRYRMSTHIRALHTLFGFS